MWIGSWWRGNAPIATSIIHTITGKISWTFSSIYTAAALPQLAMLQNRPRMLGPVEV